jgi:ABC-type glycerol-3-phosphate transport system substrate-binding protein
MRIKIVAALLMAVGLATTLGACVASATQPASPAKSGTEHFWVSDFNPKT